MKNIFRFFICLYIKNFSKYCITIISIQFFIKFLHSFKPSFSGNNSRFNESTCLNVKIFGKQQLISDSGLSHYVCCHVSLFFVLTCMFSSSNGFLPCQKFGKKAAFYYLCAAAAIMGLTTAGLFRYFISKKDVSKYQGIWHKT